MALPLDSGLYRCGRWTERSREDHILPSLSRDSACVCQADRLALELYVDAYTAAPSPIHFAGPRGARESFVFEPVFLDPAGDKREVVVAEPRRLGYNTILATSAFQAGRVGATRGDAGLFPRASRCFPAANGSRYPARCATCVPRSASSRGWVFDNDDLGQPFPPRAVFEDGVMVSLTDLFPNGFGRCSPTLLIHGSEHGLRAARAVHRCRLA